MHVMLLPRPIVILHDEVHGSRWYNPGLVDVEAYPELAPYCVAPDPAEVA